MIGTSLGKLLDNFRIEVGPKKHQAMIRSLELSAAPRPHLPGRGKGLEIELIIDHAYMMKPTQKSLNYRDWRTSGLVNRCMFQEGGKHQLHRDRSSCAQDTSRPHLMYPILCYIISRYVIISLSSVSHYSKHSIHSIEPKEGTSRQWNIIQY